MLGDELELVGGWLVDPRGRIPVEDLRSCLRSGSESFGVDAADGHERGVTVTVDGVASA